MATADEKPSSWTADQEAAFQALDAREAAAPPLPRPTQPDPGKPLLRRPAQKPDSPYGWVLVGFLLAALGMGSLVFASHDWLILVGIIASGVGGTLMLVGTIAAGVRMGMRLVRWDQHDDER